MKQININRVMKNRFKKLFLTVLTLILIVTVAIPLTKGAIFIFNKVIARISLGYMGQFEKYRVGLVKFFPFTQDNSLQEWQEKIFKNRVLYTVGKEEALSCVKATSNASASAMYYTIKLDVKNNFPVVSWKWNVEKFPDKKLKEDLASQQEDDFAGRVYVIFTANFLLNSKVLEYVWAETIPAGTIGSSPYSKNIKLIVARSGPNPDKKWFLEERDMLADYRKAFGDKPEHDIGAVAFMTNAEHTGSSAEAMYTDIKLGYKKNNENEKGR